MIRERIKRIRKFQWIILIFLVITTALFYLQPLVETGYKLPISRYNEGWNAYFSLRAISGKNLYSNNELISNNYPPLFFYIAGALGKVLGDYVLAGRYLAWLALFTVSFEVGYIVKRLGGRLFESIFSAVFCLSLFVTVADSCVGINEPQILSHALLLWALILTLPGKKSNSNQPKLRQENTRFFLSACIASAGLLVKHNTFPLLAAIACDLFFKSRRHLVIWLGSLIMITGSFIAITEILGQFQFLNQLLIGRIYDVQKLYKDIFGYGSAFIIPFIVSLTWSFLFFKKQKTRVIIFYFLIATVIDFFTLGGSGVFANLLFDVFISMSVILGLVLVSLRNSFPCKTISSQNRRIIYLFMPLILSFNTLLQAWNANLFGIFVRNLFHGKIIRHEFDWIREENRIFLKDAQYLHDQPGKALCENITLCFVSNKPFIYDPFLVNQKILTGKIDEVKVLNLIKTGYFNIIQLNEKLDDKYSQGLPYTFSPQSSKNERFSENFFRAMGNYYILSRSTKTGFFYIPKVLNDKSQNSKDSGLNSIPVNENN